jgi:hypothetical protein
VLQWGRPGGIISAIEGCPWKTSGKNLGRKLPATRLVISAKLETITCAASEIYADAHTLDSNLKAGVRGSARNFRSVLHVRAVLKVDCVLDE